MTPFLASSVSFWAPNPYADINLVFFSLALLNRALFSLSLSLSLAILLTGVVKRDDDMLLWFSLVKGVVSPLKRKCNAQAV